MFKRRASALLLAAAAFLLVPATGAQAQTTGRIMGQVVDAQGAALPGATVTGLQPESAGRSDAGHRLRRELPVPEPAARALHC